MQTITKEEIFNIDRAGYILEHWDELVNDIVNQDNSNTELTKKQFHSFVNQAKILHDGLAATTVTYSQKTEQGGRCFAHRSISLQGMPKAIRHSITDGIYIDIDIVNAHPNILMQMWEKEASSQEDVARFKCPSIKHYVENRDEILLDFIANPNIPEKYRNRDNAKKYFLVLMNKEDDIYDENSQKTKISTFNEFTKMFKHESSIIHKYYSQKDAKKFKTYKSYKNKMGKENNIKASYCSFLISDVENSIMNSIMSAFNDNVNLVPCFDGVMVPSWMNVDEIALKFVEKHILDNTGYNVKLAIKPFDHKLKVFDDPNIRVPKYKIKRPMYYNDYRMFVGIDKEHTMESVDNWAKECMFTLINMGKTKIIRKNMQIEVIGGKTVKTANYAFMDADKTIDNARAFINILNPKYDHTFFNLNSHYKKSNSIWKDTRMQKYKFENMRDYIAFKLQNDELRNYDGIDFMPYTDVNPCSKRVFNTFTEFPNMKRNPNPDIDFEKSLTYNLITSDLCSGNNGEYNHFLDFLADIIQDPCNVKGNAHYFGSEKQGVGKGIMAKFLTLLFGNEWVISIGNPDRYLGQFNSLYSYKLLKIFEELGSEGSIYNNMNRMKEEITAPMQRFESKRENEISIRNCARIIGFGNYINRSVFVGDKDRRWTIHVVNCEHAGNSEYYSKIIKEIEDPEFISSAFHYFKNRKYNPDNVRFCYNTEAKEKQKIEQLKSGYKFIVDFIERTFAGEDVESKSPDDETFRFPFSSLNDEFKKLYAGNRQDTLKKQLLELGIEVKNKRKHRHGNTLTQCVTLYPPDVQKAIRTHLDSDLFEINLKVDEDNDKEDVIKLMDEIAELRRILKIKEDLLEKISIKPA